MAMYLESFDFSERRDEKERKRERASFTDGIISLIPRITQFLKISRLIKFPFIGSLACDAVAGTLGARVRV